MEIVKADAGAMTRRARERNPKAFDRLMASAIVRSFGECWPFTAGLTKDGYGQLRVDGPKRRAHRVMFSLFFPDVAAPVVRHTCNNPACINPAHLRAGTPKDNAEDRMNCGRGGDLRGRNNGRAVISEAQALEIRASNESGPTLAARFGVTRQAIYRVRHRKSWSHV